MRSSRSQAARFAAPLRALQLPGRTCTKSARLAGRYVMSAVPLLALLAGGVIASAAGTARLTTPSPVASASRSQAYWSGLSPVDTITGPTGLTGVSCPTTTFCMAVDGGGNAVIWAMSSSNPPMAIDEGQAITSVSCATAAFCAAGDHAGNILMWTGSSWAAPQAVDPDAGPFGLTSISCSSPSFCVAADGNGNVTYWNGTAWTAPRSLDPGHGSLHVACGPRHVCALADNSGYAAIFNGQAWGPLDSIDPGGTPVSVSCSGTASCLVAGYFGHVETYDGTSWSAPREIDPAGFDLTVSCPLPYACYAVDAAGNALSWNGVTWSKPASVDPNRLEAVSCATQYFCMAVDSAGDALTYDAPVGPSLSSLSPASGPLTGTTTVTITGKGLSGATSVDFGSVPAKSFTVVSPEEIQAQSPAGTAGEVPVVVSTPSGSSSPAMYCGDAFYYGGALPSPVSGPLTTMAPLRITDTRTGSSYPKAGHAIDSCSTLDVAVQGVGNIPSSSVGAVVANVTVVSPTAAGYLTLYPKGSIRPLASAINFTYGETVANRVEVPLDPATGEISVYNGSDGSVNVVIDVEGYVLSQSATGSYYNPVNPLRICDTRANNPSTLNGAYAQCNAKTLSPGNPLTVQVSSLGTIPTGATAVEVTLTATNGASSGYLSAYPAGQSPPTSSDLNFAIGETIANSASVELSPTGTMDLVSNARTDVIVDVEGYYASVGKSLEIVSPVRLADTRPGSGEPYAGKTLSGGSSLIVQVAGASVPQGAVAAAVNLTIVGTNYDGYMTAYPPGSPVPTASNVNWYAGTNISALATPKLSSSGGLALYDAIGQANVIVDLEAFYD